MTSIWIHMAPYGFVRDHVMCRILKNDLGTWYRSWKWAGFDDGGADTGHTDLSEGTCRCSTCHVLRGLQVVVDRGHLHRRRPSTNPAGTRSRKEFLGTSCICLFLKLELWFGWKCQFCLGKNPRADITDALDTCERSLPRSQRCLPILTQQIIMTVKP